MKRPMIIATLLLACVVVTAPALGQGAADPRFLFPDRTQAQAPAPSGAPAAQAPASAPPIVVTAPAPGGLATILSSLQMVLGALIAGFLGKLAFKPAAPSTPPAAAGGDKVAPATAATIVASLFHSSGTSLIGDPATRAAVDAALLGIVQSGVPGSAITAAAGFVPGVAPIVSIIEPLVRDAVIARLRAGAGGGAPAGASDPKTADMPARLDAIQAVLHDLLGRFPRPAAG